MVVGSPIWVFPMLSRVQVGSALHVEHQGLQSVRYVDSNEQESSDSERREGGKMGSLVGIDSNILDSSSRQGATFATLRMSTWRARTPAPAYVPQLL